MGESDSSYEMRDIASKSDLDSNETKVDPSDQPGPKLKSKHKNGGDKKPKVTEDKKFEGHTETMDIDVEKNDGKPRPSLLRMMIQMPNILIMVANILVLGVTGANIYILDLVAGNEVSYLYILLSILCVLWRVYDKYMTRNNKTHIVLFKLFKINIRMCLRIFILAWVLSSIIVSLLNVVSLENDLVSTHNIHNITMVAIAASLEVLVLVLLGLSICVAIWWPFDRRGPDRAALGLLICNVMQVIVASLIIILNFYQVSIKTPVSLEVVIEHRDRSWITHFIEKMCFFQYTGALLMATSAFGLMICSAVRESNRLDGMIAKFIFRYTLLNFVVAIFCWVYFGIAVHANLRAMSISNQYGDDDGIGSYTGRWVSASNTNIALSTISLVLVNLNLVCCYFMRMHPQTNFKVEVLDLFSLTPKQREAYAGLIDKYGRNYPSASKGPHAISLMQSYAEAEIPGMDCLVLRVYRVNKNGKSNVPSISYDEIKAWNNLDSNSVLFSHDCQVDGDDKKEGPKPGDNPVLSKEGKPLSKNQLKKLKKQQEAEANGTGKKNKKDAIKFPLEQPKSEEDIKRELEFNEALLATEALVLFTRINQYDLTSAVDGSLAEYLQRLLGGRSWFKPLVVRMGLMATHWPFRQSIFYTAPTKKPVARSAAILRALVEWNRQQPSKERCTVLLDPMYQDGKVDQSIIASGWNPAPLPASHVIDLRPHKCANTVEDYLKAIKYRNQAGAFNKANGECIETTDFNVENCETVMRLWANIAEKRSNEGHTSVLVKPTTQLLHALGDPKVNEGHRSLLFLKVEDKIIASCVLFRLGDTITSDLQGLDHELARKYKAYFVMMQHTISIAIKEGLNFVDFGPTTSKPKMDIGATSLPLTGAMYSTSPILNLSLKYFANSVST